jgi:hypothetical protein
VSGARAVWRPRRATARGSGQAARGQASGQAAERAEREGADCAGEATAQVASGTLAWGRQ